VPKASQVAALINPNYPAAKSQSEELQAAAIHLGVTLIVLSASTENDIDVAFTILAQRGAGALVVTQDPFLGSINRDKLIALAAGRAMPAIYPFRDFPAAGGLISYGTDFAEGYRQAGIYVGKIPTKFELVINLKTAKALGLEVPDKLLALADEVIE
jgi:putative ABC transport system substrate-binding protein